MNDRPRERRDVAHGAPGSRTFAELLPSQIAEPLVQSPAAAAAEEGARARRAISGWDFSQLSFSDDARGAGGASGEDGTAAAPAAGAQVHRAAAHGFGGAARPLPFLEIIQPAFGAHDVREVRAYLGGPAAEAAAAMNAAGFASGERVAFGAAPDLFLAAHEAAHVVQQRHGVQLPQGVGALGDEHERHANEVATLVTQGASAEALLDRYGDASAGAASRDQAPVQHFREDAATETRVSDNGSLMVRGGRAYASEESFARSIATLAEKDSRLELTAGERARAPVSLAPPGTSEEELAELFEVVVRYKHGAAGGPSSRLGRAAHKFNLKPEEYVAEVQRRIERLDDFLERLKAFQEKTGSKACDVKALTQKYADWERSWKDIDGPTFRNDFAAAGDALQSDPTWRGFARFREQLTSIRDSYRRDLAPENTNRMIVPGDCGEAAATLMPGGENENLGNRAPQVGDRLKVDFSAVEREQGWNYHYASTVLADGEDLVTLETAADPSLPKLTRSNWKFQLYGKGKQSFWYESWTEYADSMAKRGDPLPPEILAEQQRLAVRTSEASGNGARTPEAEVLPRSEQLADELEVAGQRAGEVAQASMHDAAQGASRASEAALRTAARAARAHIDRSFIRAGEVLGPYLRPLGKIAVAAALIYDSVKVVLAIIADHKLGDQRMTKTRDELGGVVGAWSGMFAGGYAGAALGTAIWPGIGTFVGALLGGVAGGLLGSAVIARVANTSFIGNLVQKWNDFWWPATAEGNAMKAKEPEVTARLNDSLAAQAEVFAEAYRKNSAVKLYRNVVWKLQKQRSFWRTVGTLGRHRLVFKSAELVSAKLELAPGPRTRINDTRTLIELRSETTETTLQEILGVDPAQSSELGSISRIRPVDGRIEVGGEESGPQPHPEGDDEGASGGRDNRPVQREPRRPVGVSNEPA